MRRLENFRVGDGRSFLTEEQLQKLPSVNADRKIATASRQYNQFNTRHMVDLLARENWLPVFAQEQNSRGERVGFQKHMIRFQQPGSKMEKVGDVTPEFVLTNAHDTSSAYIGRAGLFKLACLNGLIVSQYQFESIHIRHVGWEEKDVLEATQKVAHEVPLIMEKVQTYQGINLDKDEQKLFAEESLMVKFRVEDFASRNEILNTVTIGERTFNVPRLLEPLRIEDKPPTLWNTFNVVQEKLVKGGGFEGTVRAGSTTTRVREIGAIDEKIRVNQELWGLMEMFRKMKSPNA